MRKKGFLIIALIFWIMYTSCILFMHQGYIMDKSMMMTLTKLCWFLLAIASLTMVYSYDNFSKKGLLICINSLFFVGSVIVFNDFKILYTVKITILFWAIIFFIAIFYCWNGKEE